MPFACTTRPVIGASFAWIGLMLFGGQPPSPAARVGDGDGDGDGVGDGVGEGDAVSDGVACVCIGALVGVSVRSGVALGVALAVGLGLALAAALAVAIGLGLAVGTAVVAAAVGDAAACGDGELDSPATKLPLWAPFGAHALPISRRATAAAPHTTRIIPIP